MKTKYINADRNDGRVRTELREIGRMHLFALVELLQERTVKPIRVGFAPPGEDNARAFLYLDYSLSEQLRFYVSPGRAPGRYVADKIDFVFFQDGSAVLLEVTKEEWANELYDLLERSGAVAENITKGQATSAN